MVVWCHFLIPTCLCLHDCHGKINSTPPPTTTPHTLFHTKGNTIVHTSNSTKASAAYMGKGPWGICLFIFICWSKHGDVKRCAARQSTGLECSTVCSERGGGTMRQSRCYPSGGVLLSTCSQTPRQVYECKTII